MLKVWFVSILIGVSTLGTALADTQPVLPAGNAPIAGTPVAGQPPQPGFGGTLMLFLPMLAVFYFLMLRPQQKKLKDQQEMLTALKHGDEILTNSGILGKVTGITD